MTPVRRIAIVGAESTGKSWLAEQLCDMLKRRGHTAQVVPEVLRTWCDRAGRTPLAHEQMGIAQTQAQAVLAIKQGVVISDTTPLMTAVYSQHIFQDTHLYPMAMAHQQCFDTTLLTGLDLPWVADGLQREGAHVRGPVDSLLRQALDASSTPYRVVYGQGFRRLNNALLALGWPGEDAAAWQSRQNAQFALNEGRTAWLCEKCSDSACEHKLFSRLL